MSDRRDRRAGDQQPMVPELPIAARALQVAQDALTQIESHERDCVRHREKIEGWMTEVRKSMADGFREIATTLADQAETASERRGQMHDKIDKLRSWMVGLVIAGLGSTLLIALGLAAFLLSRYAIK